MSLTRDQAEDLLEENYGDWSYDDPEWWTDMIEMLMEYPSVRALRRSGTRHGYDQHGIAWRIPKRWPGSDRDPLRS